jgi:hypothetical protein
VAQALVVLDRGLFPVHLRDAALREEIVASEHVEATLHVAAAEELDELMDGTASRERATTHGHCARVCAVTWNCYRFRRMHCAAVNTG